MIVPHWSAEWPLSPQDMDWLTRVYLPDRVRFALANIAFAHIALSYNPDQQGVNDVDIYLHRSTWTDADGNADAGLFTPLSSSNPHHKIEIAWDREMQSQRVLQHEICHMFLFMNAVPDWQLFQHGMNTPDPKTRDAFLLTLVTLGRQAYPRGHSSDPFLSVGF